jgi:Ca2+-binding RTX toxin-like protein
LPLANLGAAQVINIAGFGATTILNFEEVVGGLGNDTLTGNAGANTLLGNFGNDILSGADGDDVLYGGNDTDTLYGGIGNDYLDGGFGTDTLYGNAGFDTINGGAGNDILYGGALVGNVIVNDGGADRFYMIQGWGQDTVWGFEDSGTTADNLDYFHMQASGGASFAQLTISQQGADTLVTYTAQPSNTILIKNTLASNITANDFLF